MKFQKLLASILMVGFVLSSATPARAVPLNWDLAGTPATPSGGTGIWDQAADSWANSVPEDVAWVNANLDEAVFAGTAGAVALDEDILAGISHRVYSESAANLWYSMCTNNLEATEGRPTHDTV